ncbi:MAG: HAMP domain-containing histidine kinase [Planctomycetes bacterium]|nr:HAMP domain-containing histidine kinase [Planctomycetota bacterium]
MARAVIAYLLLVLAPSAVLAGLAFRAAGWDRERGLEELAARARNEAEALARRVEAALGDAARRAREDPVSGYAQDGRWLGWSLDPPPPDDEAVASSAEELRLFRLSLRGGESYEALGDPARALDAFSFYLARIRSPVLRARLTFAAGRAALAAGSEALGRALLERVLGEAPPEACEDGLPVGLLAALRLLEGPAAGGGEQGRLRAEARERLAAWAPRLETGLLERLGRSIAPGDRELAELIARRRALEAAAALRPEVLASAPAALAGDALLLAEPVPEGLAGPARGARSIRCARVALPPLEAGGLAARLEPGPAAAEASTGRAGSPGPEDSPGRAACPVRLGPEGPAVARVLVEDPAFAAQLEALDRRRALLASLVGLLLLGTLAGGAALAAYLARERALGRLRVRLLANVSHEIKTPVTAIRMLSEVLAHDAPDAAKASRYARLLAAESGRLSQLVENLLDLSRPARAGEALALEPVDLAAVARRVAEGAAAIAREEGVAFRLEGVPPEGGDGSAVEAVVAVADPAAVERILSNLLDNAIKYRRAEGPEVVLSLAAGPGEARIAVRDNGVGIPRRDRERVFEELYRVRYDDYAVKGSGLGLAIARRLARKLGGDIELESREGEGSTFTLRLPREARREAALEAPPEAPGEAPGEPPRPTGAARGEGGSP